MTVIQVRDRGGRWVPALVDEADRPRLGRFAWFVLPGGLVARHGHVNGRRRVFYLHREVVGATHGDGLVVEHVNERKWDNRRENLRVRYGPSSPSGTFSDVSHAHGEQG